MKRPLLLLLTVAASVLQAYVPCTFNGSEMTVTAPSSKSLTLLWDSEDKGDDPAAWTHSHVITEAAPAGGARYTVDLGALGITNGQPCCIAIGERIRFLDKLEMTSKAAYVKTDFKDTDVHGIRFGFYGNSGNSGTWNMIMSSQEKDDNDVYGFVIAQSNADWGRWFWVYSGYRSNTTGERPAVNTNSFNHAVLENGTFTLNGEIVKSGLPDGSVGQTGVNIFLGKTSDHASRFHYGWWSYVRFDDANGNALLDCVPAQRASDGKVGFYDRVTSKLILSTGGADLNAGTVTNETGAVITRLQRVTPNHMISLDLTGSKLYARVPAGHAGAKLLLAWDAADRGRDPANWPNRIELTAAVGTGGGSYGADLAKLGVRNGQICRVFSVLDLALLDMLKMPASTTYINTGVRDSACYGVRFGFYGTGISAAFGNVIGTSDSGLAVGANNLDMSSWYWCCNSTKSVAAQRPTVKTNAINDVAFMDGNFTLNGNVVASGLFSTAVGETGMDMYLGRFAHSSRFQYGWWSYVRFDDVDGRAVLDYIPARLANGTVGFYDRATASFVGSSATGAFEAGTVTNESISIIRAVTTARPHSIPELDVDVTKTAVTVTVPAALADEQLLLLWDTSDKGDDLNAWTYRRILAAALPAEESVHSIDLAASGITADHVCRIVSLHRLKLLDMLKMPNTTTYIDTGITDTLCYGIRAGFYGNEGHTSNKGTFQTFIGTGSDIGTASPNCFGLGMNNARFDSWAVIYRTKKLQPRPEGIYTNAINELIIADRTFTINGIVRFDDLEAGPVGESGRNMQLGTDASNQQRFLFGWWSHARFEDEAGNALIDYIPVARESDGKVGFLDRVSGAFVTSTGGGDFTAGTVTNETFTAVHLQRTFSPAEAVATATWTGSGTPGKLDDPANWTCTNLYGEEITTIPDEFTDVVFSDATAFDFPEGVPFSYASLAVGGALTQDRDWRGLDFAKISGTIDLAGHNLQSTACADMLRPVTVTDTVGEGSLTLSVTDTLTVSNAAAAFSGKMKFIKAGGGTFIAGKAGQTYAGGTDVTGGTFFCGSNAEGLYGAPGTEVTVFEGAAFNFNGLGEHCHNPFVLAGGTLVDPRYVANARLTADSYVSISKFSRCFVNTNGAPATLEMGGKTLTLDNSSSQDLVMDNLTVTGGGTIFHRTGGYVRLGLDAGSKGVTALTTTFEVQRSLNIMAPGVFLNYIAAYNGNWERGVSCPIKVCGRFTPKAKWHSVELLNGATLDLSEQTGTWNATCTAANFDGTSSLAFAHGATVTVDMGTRTPQMDDQIVSWPDKPSGVEFVWDLSLPLCVRKTGLYVKKPVGYVMTIR